MLLLFFITLLLAFYLLGMGTPVKEVELVTNLDIAKYMGQWHEIARLKNPFERNLESITATYTLLDDGTIRVENRGYNTKSHKWRTAIGKARPSKVGGRLRVAFWLPVYSNYNVLEIGTDYRWALVAGHRHKFLWILSRTPTLPPDTLDSILNIVRLRGYDDKQLIYVKHKKSDEH